MPGHETEGTLRRGESFARCGHRDTKYGNEAGRGFRCDAPATRWFRRLLDDRLAARCDGHPAPTRDDGVVEPAQELSLQEAEVMLTLRS